MRLGINLEHNKDKRNIFESLAQSHESFWTEIYNFQIIETQISTKIFSKIIKEPLMLIIIQCKIDLKYVRTKYWFFI